MTRRCTRFARTILMRLLTGCAITLVTLSPLRAEPQLTWVKQGDLHYLRWDAEANGLQLKRGERLDEQADWVNIPAVRLLDGSWGALADLSSQKGFYALFAADAPAAPEGVNLVMERSDIRIEWFPELDATNYQLYLSTSPDVGPDNYEKSLGAGTASSITVTGLEDGGRYYFALAAKNSAGMSPPGETLTGVFGPNGPVSGFAAYSFDQPDGAPFFVRAANVELSLQLEDAPPGEPSHTVTTDESGNFNIPWVPNGNYVVNWLTPDGGKGPSATLLKVTGDGATLTPLAIPGEAGTLHGSIRFASGEPAAIDDDLWDLHERAEIVALSSKGETLATVSADARGGFTLPPLPSNAFPVSLDISYQSLAITHNILKEPKANEPWMLPAIVFPERLPSVTDISFWQNGVEVEEIQPGIPVKFRAEVENPDKLPEDFRWHLIIDGKVQMKQEAEPEFTFDAVTPSGGTVSEAVAVRLNISDLVLNSHMRYETLTRVFRPLLSGCYSGLVGAWDPAQPNAITPLHPANVNIKRLSDLSLTVPTLNNTGYFEHTLDNSPIIDSSALNFIVRVEKPGYMRFLWPFNTLPTEPLFPLVPLETTTHTFNGSPALISHSNGIELGVFGLQTATGTAYTGAITVSTTAFDPSVRHPMPPGATIQAGADFQSAEFGSKCAWVEFRDASGGLLTPNANLVWVTNAIAPVNLNEPVFIQSETTGRFEAAGTAVKSLGSTSYMLPINKGGFYIFARAHPARQIRFSADRSLNYPFNLLVGPSFFPVRARAPSRDDLNLFLPRGQPVSIRVIDLRQSPGLHFPDPASPTTPTPEFSKNVIIHQTLVPNASSSFAPHTVQLSMGSSIPALLRSSATRITDLDDPDHFLGHPNVRNVTREAGARSLTAESEGRRYYAEIAAPTFFSTWKSMNGFPQTFGAPMPDVAEDDYASAYYYNLGDLGFARAQSMRVKPGADGLPDVAFYVTNYRSLEDARCGKNVVATVCMSYAYQSDLHRAPHRHTRFYVYGADDYLIPSADLDGAGNKGVPGSCITCHGGNQFNPEKRLLPLDVPPPDLNDGSPPRPRGGAYVAPTADLGSRFLPFDLESYTYHPAFGVQHLAFARMNAAVLKTMPDSTPADVKAIPATVAAWYGNADPLANPLHFDIHARPADWPNALNYEAFKVGCRVCHISRDLGTGPQFSDATRFSGFGYAVCSSIYMPNAQRTWSTLWGTKAARTLGNTSVEDLPALLHFIEGGSGTCPSLPR